MSDIHIGKHNSKQNRVWSYIKSFFVVDTFYDKRATRIFKRVNEENKILQERGEKSILIMTGDLSDDGRKKQLKKLKSIMSDNLTSFKSEEILTGRIFFDTNFLVPGNHDYGLDGNYIGAFNPYFKVLHGIKAKKFKVRKYIPFKKEVVNDDLFFPRFTEIKKQGQNRLILLIGLDSMQGRQQSWKKVLANGDIGTVQLKNLEKRLKEKKEYDNAIKIVYLHHHPKDSSFTTGLDKNGEFTKMMEKMKIDLVLCGHEHPKNREIFKIGNVPYSCAFSSTNVNNKVQSLNAHHIIVQQKNMKFHFDLEKIIEV